MCQLYRKSSVVRPRRRLVDKIKHDVRNLGLDDTDLRQDRVNWFGVLNSMWAVGQLVSLVKLLIFKNWFVIKFYNLFQIVNLSNSSQKLFYIFNYMIPFPLNCSLFFCFLLSLFLSFYFYRYIHRIQQSEALRGGGLFFLIEVKISAEFRCIKVHTIKNFYVIN